MIAAPKSFLEHLLEKKLLTPEAYTDVKKISDESHKDPTDIVLERKLIPEEALFEARAAFTGFPYRNMEGFQAKYETLREVPEEAARHYRFFPIKIDRAAKVMEVGMVTPEDVGAHEALQFITMRMGLAPKIFLVSPQDFGEILKQYRTLKGEVEQALEELQHDLDAEKAKERAVAEAKKKQAEEKLGEDAPITKMVAVILKHAIEGRASDIHIEPIEKEVRVRFRVDGVLHTSIILPKQVHAAVIARIKILSTLKIDETRKPQDGRFHTRMENRKIDFRVSILPTVTGEKVVMRILDPIVGIKTFKDLGIQGHNLQLIESAIEKPYGMVLITGPTGSGKTTTLYSALGILNEEGVNISSLEDPVEYFIEGVNQSQIQPEVEFTFASGLRSLLRQDPDIILVGEIRDGETAELAVHAALTGHLVLSTLHTNDALGVFPRLIDMGIQPFLLPPSVLLAVAQRLVRRLCQDCKSTYDAPKEKEAAILRELAEISEEDRKLVSLTSPIKLWEAKGCKKCGHKGTKGRVGIYEMLAVTPQLEAIIIGGITEEKLRVEAKRQKMVTMKQDGFIKAMQGMTTLEEVLQTVETDVEEQIVGAEEAPAA
ncbi:MAG: GspE/PulE family protein [bacterium]|nr:GspE/PulE family protein [bacterium]